MVDDSKIQTRITELIILATQEKMRLNQLEQASNAIRSNISAIEGAIIEMRKLIETSAIQLQKPIIEEREASVSDLQ